MSEWKPIETCPQDGRWVLVIEAAASYVPAAARPIGPGSSVFELFWGDGTLLPSHWQPLPDPPK